MKYTDILFLLAIAVVAFVSGHYLWPDSKAQTTLNRPDTIYVPLTVKDSLPAYIDVLRITDSTINVNVDSIWEAAKAYALANIKAKDSAGTLNNYNHIAIADTSYQDSILTENIKFISRIPLDPKSYFKRFVTYKERQISYPVIPGNSFWDRFNWSVNAGFGYGLIRKQFDFYAGFGGSFSLK